MSNVTHDNWEDELETIRERLYERVKGMTPEEWIAHLRARAEPIMRKYNLKWATLQPVIPHVRKRVGEEVLIRYE